MLTNVEGVYLAFKTLFHTFSSFGPIRLLLNIGVLCFTILGDCQPIGVDPFTATGVTSRGLDTASLIRSRWSLQNFLSLFLIICSYDIPRPYPLRTCHLLQNILRSCFYTKHLTLRQWLFTCQYFGQDQGLCTITQAGRIDIKSSYSNLLRRHLLFHDRVCHMPSSKCYSSEQPAV